MVATLGLPATLAAADPSDFAQEILSKAIQINTVNPPGNEAALAAYLVGVLARQDIEARIVETPSAPGEPGRAAAWGRVKGRGEAPPIVLLSHLDVVAADPDQWNRPPFEGAIEGGFVHGRGSLDAKGAGVIQLVTLVQLAKRSKPLRRDVIYLATPDEESGGIDGAGYLVREHPEILGGAEYLLTEGGGIRPETESASAIWGVSVSEKSPCWLEISVVGQAGHSSAPRRDAAVPRLIGTLDRIRRLETPLQVLPEVAHMFAKLSEGAGPEDAPGFASLEQALAEDSPFRRRFLRNPGYNALVRNTISITVLEGSRRTNVAPAIARAHLDARLLPGQGCGAFKASIEQVIDDPRVSVKTLLSFPSNASTDDTPLYRAIEHVAERTDPGARVVPRVIGGFTDAHWFRELGIVAYGFLPRRLADEEAKRVHGPNERISVENLSRGVDTLIEILEELDRR